MHWIYRDDEGLEETREDGLSLCRTRSNYEEDDDDQWVASASYGNGDWLGGALDDALGGF